MKFAISEICNAAWTNFLPWNFAGFRYVTTVWLDSTRTSHVECYSCGKPAGATRIAS